MISKSATIPTNNGKKKVSRKEMLLEAMDSPFNFFVDLIDDQSVLRAPFSAFDVFFTLSPEQFGLVTDWRSYMGMSRYDEAEESCTVDSVLDFQAQAVNDDEDEDLVVSEVGHLPSLQQYKAFDIDRDPATLQAWI